MHLQNLHTITVFFFSNLFLQSHRPETVDGFRVDAEDCHQLTNFVLVVGQLAQLLDKFTRKLEK